MAMEFVIGIAVAALLLGALVGYFLPGGNKKKARVAELEGALESAQDELAEYKREVFGQFAQTADKFRALDKSYNELHRQLAESSVALCGDAATPLLEAPGDQVSPEVANETDAQLDADQAGESAPDDLVAPAESINDSIVVGESDEVPTLTDVDAEVLAQAESDLAPQLDLEKEAPIIANADVDPEEKRASGT